MALQERADVEVRAKGLPGQSLEETPQGGRVDAETREGSSRLCRDGKETCVLQAGRGTRCSADSKAGGKWGREGPGCRDSAAAVHALSCSRLVTVLHFHPVFLNQRVTPCSQSPYPAP